MNGSVTKGVLFVSLVWCSVYTMEHDQCYLPHILPLSLSITSANDDMQKMKLTLLYQTYHENFKQDCKETNNDSQAIVQKLLINTDEQALEALQNLACMGLYAKDDTDNDAVLVLHDVAKSVYEKFIKSACAMSINLEYAIACTLYNDRDYKELRLFYEGTAPATLEREEHEFNQKIVPLMQQYENMPLAEKERIKPFLAFVVQVTNNEIARRHIEKKRKWDYIISRLSAASRYKQLIESSMYENDTVALLTDDFYRKA